MKRIIARTAATVLVVFTLAQPLVAQAAMEQSGTRQLRVLYRSSEVASDNGARILLDRLSAAASKVCRLPEDRFNLIHRKDYASCRANALANAVATVGAPALTAMHKGEPASAPVVLARK
jgi:UrcA family protein